VQLFRPLGRAESGVGTQELKWPTNLSDLKTNAALFDPPTRTYRLPLENAPDWVAGTGSRDRPPVRLRAVLTTIAPGGERRVLRSDYVING
jgi:hypothetical protein